MVVPLWHGEEIYCWVGRQPSSMRTSHHHHTGDHCHHHCRQMSNIVTWVLHCQPDIPCNHLQGTCQFTGSQSSLDLIRNRLITTRENVAISADPNSFFRRFVSIYEIRSNTSNQQWCTNQTHGNIKIFCLLRKLRQWCLQAKWWLAQLP